MFKIPLNELKEKLQRDAHLTAEDVEFRIKKKINELSGLISEEGACHILANELGVKVLEEEGRLKIKSIYSGMRNVEVLGKVINKFEIREFEKGERKGKVGNFLIGDETGTLRIVCWHEQTEVINQIKEGDLVLIKSGYAKENNLNQKELHLNERSKAIINPEGETIKEVRASITHERKKIGELKEGANGIEILATVVQVSEPRFFNICPECNKKVTEKEGGFSCDEHGQIVPTQSYVLNLVLDDGSGTVRGVFWKNQTNNLLGKKEEDVIKFKDNPNSFEEVKTELLGEQYRLVGRVNRNEMFERLELNVQMVYPVVLEDEIKKLEE